jgi:hypothetical protein
VALSWRTYRLVYKLSDKERQITLIEEGVRTRKGKEIRSWTVNEVNIIGKPEMMGIKYLPFRSELSPGE